MTKGIIFDMGGVLVDLDIKRCSKNFREIAGFDKIDEFLDPCHQKGFIKSLEAGAITEEEFYAECRKYCRPSVTDAQMEYCLASVLSEIHPGKVGYLKELSSKFDLFMLSNNNPITTRECERIFKEAGIPLETTFKGTFLSWQMKMLKPSPEIYREAIRRTGYDRSELCFVDDSPSNVQAGLDRGIKAVLYRSGDDLRAALDPVLYM